MTDAEVLHPDQPPGFPGDDNPWLPPAAEAGERILEFVSWFGDGQVEVPTGWNRAEEPPLYARDLEAVAKAARKVAAVEAACASVVALADSICPDGTYDKKDKAWRVAHARRITVEEIRAALADPA